MDIFTSKTKVDIALPVKQHKRYAQGWNNYGHMKTKQIKLLILLFLLLFCVNVYSQDFLSKKGLWEFVSDININIPKQSNYNYSETFPDYFIDVKVEPKTVVTPFINLSRNELLFNIKDKHILRFGYGISYYKKKYQLSYSGSDITRNGAFVSSIPDSAIHTGIETFYLKNFGINLSVLYFYKISKSIFFYNKFEANFAAPYKSFYTFSDTARYNNGQTNIQEDKGIEQRLHTMIAFPFPTLTLNYYTGVSFALSSDFTITPNIGIQFLCDDFDKKRELYRWDQDLLHDGTYHINKHYLFIRAGINLLIF